MAYQPIDRYTDYVNGTIEDYVGQPRINQSKDAMSERSPIFYNDNSSNMAETTGLHYKDNLLVGSQGFRHKGDYVNTDSNNSYNNGNNSTSRRPDVSSMTSKDITSDHRAFHQVSDKDSQVTEKLLAQSGAGRRKKSDINVKIDMDTLLPKPSPDEDDNWSDSDDDDDEIKGNIASKCIIATRKTILRGFESALEKTGGYLIKVVLLLAYIAYFIAAMCYRFGDEGSYRLLGCTIIGVIIISRGFVSRAYKWLFRKITGKNELSESGKERVMALRFFSRWLLYGGVTGLVVWVLIDKGIREPTNLRSIPGFIVFLLLSFFFSAHPGKINYHTIFWSIGLQFIFALLVLKLDFGKDAVFWLQGRVDEFFENSIVGSKLLFGDGYAEHYMIFGALPLIFFTNGVMTLLYYLGAMQFVIRVIGSFLTFALETSPVESMSVAAGTFLEGITALTAFRPYLRFLSKSQLFLVMTSCFSSIGGAYLAVLSKMGVSVELLIGAMLVSAPATFTVCKLMVPETQVTKTKGDRITNIGDEEKSKYSNGLDAVQTGALAMLSVVGNIAVSAFALVCLIEWINQTLMWFGDRVGVEGLTIEHIASYLLYPVPLAMGIEPVDCRRAAMLYGYRLGSSNIIAFFKLTDMRANRIIFQKYIATTNGTVSFNKDDIILDQWNQTLKLGFINERSEAIVTYALCGFSSFLSVAIHLSMMATFVPNRKVWLAKIAMAGLVAGNIANCMTGCFACLFFSDS